MKTSKYHFKFTDMAFSKKFGNDIYFIYAL